MSVALSVIKVLRRHAYLMSGCRASGDRVIEGAAEAIAPVLRPPHRLVPALAVLYSRLPREPVTQADEAIRDLVALPFYNRASLVLTLIQGLSPDQAAHILGLPEPCVRDLAADGLRSVEPESRAPHDAQYAPAAPFTTPVIPLAAAGERGGKAPGGRALRPMMVGGRSQSLSTKPDA